MTRLSDIKLYRSRSIQFCCWTMSLATFLLLVAFNWVASWAAGGTQHGLLIPKWRTDLRAAIGSAPIPYSFGGRIEVKGEPVTSLHFIDNYTLVATFVVHESERNPELPRHDAANAPLRLRAIFLDALSGKIATSRDWPSDSIRSIIVTTLDREILIQTGDELALYGSDLQKLKSIKLPPSSPVEWGAVISPTRKNILFVRVHPELKQRPLSWIWVQTDTLDILHSWEAQPNGVESITDDKIALSTWCGYIGCGPTKLEIRGLSTDWVTIGPGGGRPSFVDSDALFLTGNLNTKSPAQLIRTNGDVLFSEEQPSQGDIWWTSPTTSSQGDRFIAAGTREEGGMAAFDVDGHSVLRKVLVYDLYSQGRTYVLDVKGPKIQDTMLFALSQDGSRLAILNKESVELFLLPPLRVTNSDVPPSR
jgi:hypothetical protein